MPIYVSALEKERLQEWPVSVRFCSRLKHIFVSVTVTAARRVYPGPGVWYATALRFGAELVLMPDNPAMTSCVVLGLVRMRKV